MTILKITDSDGFLLYKGVVDGEERAVECLANSLMGYNDVSYEVETETIKVDSLEGTILELNKLFSSLSEKGIDV